MCRMTRSLTCNRGERSNSIHSTAEPGLSPAISTGMARRKSSAPGTTIRMTCTTLRPSSCIVSMDRCSGGGGRRKQAAIPCTTMLPLRCTTGTATGPTRSSWPPTGRLSKSTGKRVRRNAALRSPPTPRTVSCSAISPAASGRPMCWSRRGTRRSGPLTARGSNCGPWTCPEDNARLINRGRSISTATAAMRSSPAMRCSTPTVPCVGARRPRSCTGQGQASLRGAPGLCPPVFSRRRRGRT